MFSHKGTQEIQTKRLLLRKVALEDAEAMYKNWASDPQVTKFLTWPTHEKVDTTRKIISLWMEDYDRPDFYQWMIVRKDLGEPIGTITVVRMNDRVAEAEIGYCIGRAWWGKGIVAEALQAVIEYLFRECGANRISARHDTHNPNSGAVMRKCGMSYEGTLRSADWNNQGICDVAYYSILFEEWKESK